MAGAGNDPIRHDSIAERGQTFLSENASSPHRAMASRLIGSLSVALLLFAAPAVFAQDDPEAANKKATQILLDKADDEYRIFFKQPKNTYEFWAAIKFEIDVGKFDLAALHVKRLLTNDKQKPEEVDEDLFKIEQAEGMTSFLRLVRVQRWSEYPPFQKEAEENVKLFFDRVNSVVEKKLSDPERITKFIKQLDAETVEERAFAFTQLNRSRERAVPYLIEKLQESIGKPLYHRIVDAMVNLAPETVPAYLEVFKARDSKDAQDHELRLTLLRIVRNRHDARVVPYLWHLSASPKYPALIRELALKMLGEFLEVEPDVLPPAKLALAELSDKFYRHQVKFPERIRLWKWDGKKVATEPIDLKPGDIEELFGLRYALESLDLDPAFQPGQLAFLNMMIERTILNDFEKAILQPLPTATQRLLATLDPDLLLRVLERGYDDANIPVILGMVQALGDRGELRAAKPSSFGTPQGVVRGLYYPDRRVQYAAVNALLKMPSTPAPANAGRMVDVLRRLILIDQPPAALVLGASVEKANEVFTSLKEAGFTPILSRSIQEGIEKARPQGNVELIVLHYGMSPRELPFALSQVRRDIDLGLTPILLIAPMDQVDAYQRIAKRYRNIHVLSESMLPSAEEVSKLVDRLTTKIQLVKLTPEERKRIAEVSVDVLRQMARNQIRGYDVQPALDNLTLSIGSPDLASAALETLGRLPGTTPQLRLADVVLDPSLEKLRVPAAKELNRHVQHHGLLLPRAQVEKLKRVMDDRTTPVPLRTEMAYFLGGFQRTPTRDGRAISIFAPDVPAEAPMPMEKKEKE